ncbi:MAG: hypothetical protein NC548_40450 [Lachnospiraceae bacterium]|nr:hypothetical protein [Lachnospiraceae bacterium]
MKLSIGDVIYQTDTNGTRIYRSKIKNIIVGERIVYDTDSITFDERAIGHGIFLSKEAVEARMKELRERL